MQQHTVLHLGQVLLEHDIALGHVQLDDQQERPVNTTTIKLDKRNFSQLQ